MILFRPESICWKITLLNLAIQVGDMAVGQDQVQSVSSMLLQPYYTPGIEQQAVGVSGPGHSRHIECILRISPRLSCCITHAPFGTESGPGSCGRSVGNALIHQRRDPNMCLALWPQDGHRLPLSTCLGASVCQVAYSYPYTPLPPPPLGDPDGSWGFIKNPDPGRGSLEAPVCGNCYWELLCCDSCQS